jgi:hypothetical protein
LYEIKGPQADANPGDALWNAPKAEKQSLYQNGKTDPWRTGMGIAMQSAENMGFSAQMRLVAFHFGTCKRAVSELDCSRNGQSSLLLSITYRFCPGLAHNVY